MGERDSARGLRFNKQRRSGAGGVPSTHADAGARIAARSDLAEWCPVVLDDRVHFDSLPGSVPMFQFLEDLVLSARELTPKQIVSKILSRFSVNVTGGASC